MADPQHNPDSTAYPDLWSWSLAIYGRPGFSAEAIGLQDDHGLDVNLLLYCLWAGLAAGVELGEPALAAAVAAAGPWQRAVVLPLRAVRRSLKGHAHPHADLVASLRQGIAGFELEAERGEQLMLGALPLPEERHADARFAAARNLQAYLAVSGADPASAARDGTRPARLARLLAIAGNIAEADAAACLAAARDGGAGRS
jgi:uncharacterized protein (TIGR02444 family)